MKILVVDDDLDLLDVIVFAFQRAGFMPLKASTGATAMELLHAEHPDLGVLDINLPSISGFDLIQSIRQHSDMPLLMLTVRNEEQDVVRALELGADDYMTKPFSPRILVARVRALLRRTSAETEDILRIGSLELNIAMMTLDGLEDAPLKLSQLEARLLQILAASGGSPVATDRILSHVWGSRGQGNRHLLKQLVHRLRSKLRDEPDGEPILVTVPNVGYRLQAPK